MVRVTDSLLLNMLTVAVQFISDCGLTGLAVQGQLLDSHTNTATAKLAVQGQLLDSHTQVQLQQD
jgi:hypothetical protein